jgi:PRC-barrel domain
MLSISGRSPTTRHQQCPAPQGLARMGAYGKTTEPSADKTTGAQKLWYSRQADEMRARKLIGTTVVNAANETVGNVNEIVLTRDGKVRR